MKKYERQCRRRETRKKQLLGKSPQKSKSNGFGRQRESGIFLEQCVWVTSSRSYYIVTLFATFQKKKVRLWNGGWNGVDHGDINECMHVSQGAQALVGWLWWDIYHGSDWMEKMTAKCHSCSPHRVVLTNRCQWKLLFISVCLCFVWITQQSIHIYVSALTVFVFSSLYSLFSTL